MSERFSDALTRAMQPLRRRLGMSHAQAREDDPFCETFNARACLAHLADLRREHATPWLSVSRAELNAEIAQGGADRIAPAACAQSLLPSFGDMCADFA